MTLHHLISSISHRLSEPRWMTERRYQCAHDFLTLPTPSFKYGQKILFEVSLPDVATLLPQQDSKISVVAPDGACVYRYPAGLETYETLMKTHFMKTLDAPNKLVAHHGAVVTDILVIVVPEGRQLSSPIDLQFYGDGSRFEHVFVIVERDASATIIDSTSSASYRSHVVEVFVGDHATLTYYTDHSQQEGFAFIRRSGVVNHHGSLHWKENARDGGFTQLVTSTSLAQEHATTTSACLLFAKGTQQYDLHTTVRHDAPRTTSSVTSRLVLDDHAKVIHRGLLVIPPDMAQSKATQHEDILLLSETAEVDPLPFLEVSHHDVQCSHGVTVTHLNEDKLFYLMSRGLDLATARDVYLAGFFEPLVHQMPHIARSLRPYTPRQEDL